jgi:lipopolysaccharide transport system ATP-binding protein
MSEVVIHADKLSKAYDIRHGVAKSKYATIQESLLSLPKRLFGKRETTERFWALKDVSFEINQGDRVGIIGRNGAGKSTLLKLLCRITEPTSGEAVITGRVASLLEVGTGFHPELTGRENIFMNGAILGMSRAEIKSKFDEIVAFAEVEKFIDTPVKRYSSGMYVRLAFSVAAHLEPEILIVDEVLAVGDVQFQKKCLGKMSDVAKNDGRTVLFVSHNMTAIQQLCNSAILLNKGTVIKSGNVSDVVRGYVNPETAGGNKAEWINLTGQDFKNPYFTPKKILLTDGLEQIVELPVQNDEEIWVNVEGVVEKVDRSLYVAIGVFSEDGTYIFGSAHVDNEPDQWPKIKEGNNILRCQLKKHFLNEGTYRIELYVGILTGDWFCYYGGTPPSICLEIVGGLSKSPLWSQKRLGLCAPILHWIGRNTESV